MSADTKARRAKTGRDVRNRGRGAVQQVAAPLLARADMSTEEWERQVLEMAHGLKFSQRTGGSFIARSEELSLESVRDLVQNKLLEPKFYAGAQMMFARRAAAADAAHFDGGQVTCTSCGRVIERDDMLSADSGAAAGGRGAAAAHAARELTCPYCHVVQPREPVAQDALYGHRREDASGVLSGHAQSHHSTARANIMLLEDGTLARRSRAAADQAGGTDDARQPCITAITAKTVDERCKDAFDAMERMNKLFNERHRQPLLGHAVMQTAKWLFVHKRNQEKQLFNMHSWTGACLIAARVPCDTVRSTLLARSGSSSIKDSRSPC